MDDVIDESPAPRPDGTFFLAVALITAVGAIELLAGFFHIVGKARAERAASAAVATTPAPAPAAPANVARVTPAPVTSVPSVPAPGAPLSASEQLLQEARALNQRGDTANALAKLQEAAQRDPRNAPVLAEMATIYESIQLWDRSNETWRKIQEIGPPAGDLYRLAEMKLKVGASATLPAAAKAAPNTQTAAASAPVAARAAAVDGTGTALDREGIPEGSVFGVTEISSENVPDPDAETNLRIKIAVKKRDRVPIELARLKIVVRFYDLIDNERVADTDADVNFEWLNPKHDWSETNPETLVVSYVRAQNHAVTSEAAISAAAAAVTPGKPTRSGKKRASQPVAAEPTPEGAGRKYLGYVVRIYYDDKLQTVRADPTRLLKDAPGATLP